MGMPGTYEGCMKLAERSARWDHVQGATAKIEAVAYFLKKARKLFPQEENLREYEDAATKIWSYTQRSPEADAEEIMSLAGEKGLAGVVKVFGKIKLERLVREEFLDQKKLMKAHEEYTKKEGKPIIDPLSYLPFLRTSSN